MWEGEYAPPPTPSPPSSPGCQRVTEAVKGAVKGKGGLTRFFTAHKPLSSSRGEGEGRGQGRKGEGSSPAIILPELSPPLGGPTDHSRLQESDAEARRSHAMQRLFPENNNPPGFHRTFAQGSVWEASAPKRNP